MRYLDLPHAESHGEVPVPKRGIITIGKDMSRLTGHRDLWISHTLALRKITNRSILFIVCSLLKIIFLTLTNIFINNEGNLSMLRCIPLHT